MAKTGKKQGVMVAFHLPEELVRKLDRMAKENLETRATFVRRIVLAEMKRRDQDATANKNEDGQ